MPDVWGGEGRTVEVSEGDELAEPVSSDRAGGGMHLVAAEGDLRVELVVAVDPDGARVDLVGDRDGARDVAREDGRREAVLARVGLLDDVGVVLERRDDEDRAKDLLVEDLHAGLDVGKDGRLDEVALGAVALAAGDERRALVLARLDVGRDALWGEQGGRSRSAAAARAAGDARRGGTHVELNLRDLGALERVLGRGVADLDALELGLELLEELVFDALLQVQARAGAARLAGVEVDAGRDEAAQRMVISLPNELGKLEAACRRPTRTRPS